MRTYARRLRALFVALLIAASLAASSVAGVSADAGGAPWPKVQSTILDSRATILDAGSAPWPR